MKRQTPHVFLFLNLVLLSTSLFAEPIVGTKVPDFHGQDLQGKVHHLQDYAGKIVVLEWSSPECPYSRRYYENGTLDQLYEYAARNNIVWINIVPRLLKLTARQAREFLDPLKKIIIVDSQLNISTAYGASTTPQIFIIDGSGTLSYSGAIDSTAMHKKTAARVVPYTRDALDDLLAGREVARKITRAFGCFVNNNPGSAGALPPISPNAAR